MKGGVQSVGSIKSIDRSINQPTNQPTASLDPSINQTNPITPAPPHHPLPPYLLDGPLPADELDVLLH